MNPDNHLATICLSDVYLRISKWKKVIDCLTPIIQNNPFNVHALVNFGIAETKLKNFDSANDHFARAIESDPNNVVALTNLGILFSKTKKFEIALNYFNRVLEIDANNKEASEEKKKIIKKLNT